MKKIKAPRYAENADPVLVNFIQDKLPFLDFQEAGEFYSEFVPRLKKTEIALLGCNDRYFLLSGLLNRVDAIHPWIYDRCREVEADPDEHLDLWARYHYKMICVRTIVPTPTGWVLHGDLKPGDYVFSPSGKPTKVIATTQVWTDGDCYRVTFDKGFFVIAGAEHLWTVNIQSRKRIKGTNKREGRKTVTLNTKELVKEIERSKKGSTIVSPCMPTCAPVEFSEKDLLVEPYVLGAWLGDGASDHASLVNEDREVWDEVRKSYELGKDRTPHRSAQCRTIKGLSKHLRKISVLGNKRIPKDYEFSSVEQRIRLLQGLMDTDGHCDTRGTATFVSIKPKLAHGVFRLVSSLGLKPNVKQHLGEHNGQPYPYFQVSFQSRADRFGVFKVKRKLDRATSGNIRRSGYHRFISIEKVESHPCNCIQVESSDGQYLIGDHYIPTHNSTINTFAGGIQEALIDPETAICIFANNIKIARPFLSQIKEELESNERLKDVYSDALFKDPRKQSPQWSLDGGLILKRKGNPKESTFEAHGLIDALPTGKHFPFLFYDDIINEKNVTNPEQIKKAVERTELSFPLGIGEKTRRRFSGTRYHYGDSYGQLIKDDIINARLHPATDDGTLNGNPVFLTDEAWLKVKKEMRNTVAAQMLQNPSAGQENTFHTKWLKPYWIRPTILNVYIIVDPSKGKSKTSDRTAMAVIGIDTMQNKYLLDGYCHRMPLSDRWRFLSELHRKWTNANGVQRITVGYERYGAQSDEEYFYEKMRETGQHFEIEEVNWTREVGRESKGHRVERLEPDFRGGSFFIPGRVWHNAFPNNRAVWHLEENDDEIHFTEDKGHHKQEKRAIANGERWRTFEPLRRIDEDTNIYDLTRIFMEEFSFFPFAPRDDLIDATSRIYDLDPIAPAINERVVVPDYPDA